jgi:hypothetical protein
MMSALFQQGSGAINKPITNRRVGNGVRRHAVSGGATVTFEATPQQRHEVACLVAAGNTQPVIARALGISEDTLQRHFAYELQNGREDINAALGKSIVQLALKGDRTMLIFAAKTRLGWSQRTSIGYLGADGRPIDPPPGQTFTINIIDG